MATLSPSEIAYQQAHINDNRGPMVIGVTIALMVVCTVSVGMRFFARYKRRLSFEWDDWLSVAGLVFVFLQGAVLFVSVHFGLGKHIWAVNPATVYKILEAGLFYAIIYGLVHWCIKLSILYFYKRIFTLRTPWFKIAVYILAAYTTGWMLVECFGALFQCTPVEYFWEQFNIVLDPPAKGYCGLDNVALVIATSVLNTVGDFAILFLPITMLWRLQLQTSRKLSLIGVFAVGIFACVAGIMRLLTTMNAILPGADTTWITTDIQLWTLVESCVGLICSCMPVVGPLFAPQSDKTKSYFSNRSKTGQTSSKPATAGRSGIGVSSFSHHSSKSWLTSKVDRCDNDEDEVQLRPIEHVRNGNVTIEHSYLDVEKA